MLRRFLLLLPCLSFLLCGGAGCLTSGLWQDSAGGVATAESEAAVAFDLSTGRPRTLFVSYNGGGLGGGPGYLALPLDADGNVIGQPETTLVGRPLDEINRVQARYAADVARRFRLPPAPQPIRPGHGYDLALRRADDLRRTRHLTAGPLPTAGGGVREVAAETLGLDEDHVAVAYWLTAESPPGPVVMRPRHLNTIETAWRSAVLDGLPPPKLWVAAPWANTVEVVYYADPVRRRAEHVAVLPRTLLRPAGRRAASTAGAVALTPLTVAGDVVLVGLGVVTAPVWVPAIAYGLGYVEPPRPPQWHPPLVVPVKGRR